jgi:STE24 endopeptidase
VSQRRVALWTFGVATVAFLAVAAWRIPWHPVPGGTPPPAAAESVFTRTQLDRANAYTNPARVLGWTSLAVSLAVSCLLGFTPWGPRLVGRIRGWWWVRTVLAVAAVAVIGRLATLPFAMVGHHRAVQHGLSTQGWWPWLVDLLTSLGISVVIASLLLLVLVGSARRWPQAWPALAGLTLGAMVMIGSFVYPVLVEPAFNQFTPLPDGSLRAQILHLADVEHVHLDDVLVADASRRTTTLNAYVSGYGSTRRVVLYDNVLHDLPRDQVLAIVAHELGHARHDDVLTGSVLAALGTTLGIGLLGLLVPARSRRGDGRGMRDPTTVPRVLALVAIATFLSAPVNNGLSRLIETRADVDSLEATRDPDAFDRMQKQLALHSLSDDPPQLSQLWFGSHPTTLERIAIGRQLGRQQARE